MKTFIAVVVAVLVVVGIVSVGRGGKPTTRDLAKDVCENIIEQCGSLADPRLAPDVPDTGTCIRYMDKQLVDDAMPLGLATCMADGDSCEAVVGCALTQGARERLRRH